MEGYCSFVFAGNHELVIHQAEEVISAALGFLGENPLGRARGNEEAIIVANAQ